MLNWRVMTEFFNNFIAAQRQNAVLWVPVLFAVGIGFYFSLHREPEWWGGAGVMALFSVMALGVMFHQRRVSFIFLLLLAFALVAAGWITAKVRTDLVTAPTLKHSIGPVMVEGTIHAIDMLEEGKGTRLVLKDLNIEKIAQESTPHFVRLSVRNEIDVRPGQRIRILARLNPPLPPVLPNGFDFQKHLFFKRIGGIGFALGAPEGVDSGPSLHMADRVERFRQVKSGEIGNILPPAEAAIVSALLLGERAAIPQNIWNDIRAAGLAHVISISGMHIGMIAGCLFFFLRLVMCLFTGFALRHPVKKYAAFLALVGAVAYALMVGLTVPTLRAVIMTGLVLIAIMLDRSPFSLRLVALSAMVVLLTTPEALGNPGFQMSFGAVAALIFFYDETRDFWLRLNRISSWWKKPVLIVLGAGATSLVATVATAPYTLYHFQLFPIYSVIGNILAMPMVGIVVMPAALVSYFMMPVGLEEWPLRVMGWGVRVMLDISHMIAQWPEADFGMQSWPLSALISFTLGGLILIIVRGPARWAFIFPVFAGTILVATYKMPDMLVSNTGKLVLARVEKDGVILNTRRTEKFHAENWIAAYGLRPEQVEVLPREGKIVGELGIVITCDPGSCHYRFPNGAVIAIAVTPRAAMEDCGKVDVLISKEPIKRQCRKGQVIDKWDLRRDGTHAIYADGNTITIKTVAQTRGQRPWTLSN